MDAGESDVGVAPGPSGTEIRPDALPPGHHQRSGYAFLREKDGVVTLVALNFRWEAITYQVRIDWTAAGITPPTGTWSPQDLISNTALPLTSAVQCAQGYPLTIPGRDGLVVKLITEEADVSSA